VLTLLISIKLNDSAAGQRWAS